MPVALIPAGAQFLGGALQSVFSGKRKSEKNLEDYANSYKTPNSVLDYYNKALSRYSSNPYTSQFYQNAQNNIQRNLSSGIASTTDRRGGLATIAGLTAGANDASAKAAAMAEGQQGQQLSQLGGATNMLAGEENKKYDLLFNLKALKAGAANQQQSTGIQNMFQGLGNASNYLSAKNNGAYPIGGRQRIGSRYGTAGEGTDIGGYYG